jgi:hypothetical protein
MASHLLGVLQPAVVFQVNGDAGCSPGVTSDGGEKARRFGPLPDRSPSGSKHVPSPPFQPNLRFETGVARFEGLRRSCRTSRR